MATKTKTVTKKDFDEADEAVRIQLIKLGADMKALMPGQIYSAILRQELFGKN